MTETLVVAEVHLMPGLARSASSWMYLFLARACVARQVSQAQSTRVSHSQTCPRALPPLSPMRLSINHKLTRVLFFLCSGSAESRAQSSDEQDNAIAIDVLRCGIGGHTAVGLNQG